MQPETCYARSGEVRIAYQILGNGPIDLVFVPGFISNLDHYWDEPTLAHFLMRLGSFSRLILFDKRGTGLSDRVGTLPTLEERMDDVRAVMDAAGSKRAALFGVSEGGAMSLLFAATYPERCAALALYGTYAHFFSYVLPPERFEAFVARIDERWGSGASLEAFAPSKVGDRRFTAWWARFERLGASPTAVISLMRMNTEIDVRHVLPAIRTPTLILHRVGDTRVNVEGGRNIARGVSGSQYVELPGNDHVLWAGDVDAATNAIEEFLTGSRSHFESDRVLTTVLFTDIVDSTRRITELGDHAWKGLLERHDHIVRQELVRYRGREVKTLGDGFVATFDGPARAVRCASAITDGVRSLGLDVRSGMHTGEIEIKGDDIAGIAVNTAARVSSLAGPGEVLVSSTVRDLVAGSGIGFAELGFRSLKGLQEKVRVFRVA
ncbi:adenylate/guanylate cyclase domain-containing protein [Bosea sp. BH3]|uniref:adenylate/guanylate cyclase domain-containing protein n=1 Tax=Bosea sp. BH3 TaxID=2871701 RepID=UPI0021CB2D46|nr:adenylate/guanylate cyclase domain-containing protein [Bosea sp. BH3]MCU4178256.1 adenylate/guanylate cyclase domain-containing protein [Bosea sp. BH3]